MRGWLALILIGAFMLLGGVLALVNPFAASLAVTVLVGMVFLVGGALTLWAVFSDRTQPHRGWNALVGVLGLVAGISLLADPLGGMISLTLLLAILFVLTGAARLAGAFALRESALFWPLLLSGALSVLMGVLIFALFPEVASVLMGVLLGFELLAEGVALIALGLLARRLGRDLAEHEPQMRG